MKGNQSLHETEMKRREFLSGPTRGLASMCTKKLLVVGLALTLFSGLATGASSAATTMAPPIPQPSVEPILSALVSLHGESLASWLRSQHGPVPDAETSRNLAAKAAASIEARSRALDKRQDRVSRAIEALGADVISRYSVSINAVLVHTTASQLRSIALLPEVDEVAPAPLVKMDLARSVPHIGAEKVVQQMGLEGEDVVIAIIDSGIDYTHAHLGGPGVPAAYQRALVGAESIDDTWDGEALFPTEKVIGGYDFVGPKYTHPRYCTKNLEDAGRCYSTPRPDPDPLDQHDHGTHVAGIAAGERVGAIGDGVARGARLVALKIYGPPDTGIAVDEEVDVVIDALEWVARVNLGMSVPGTAPERVDVINMSLGEPFSQGSRLFDEALEAVADLGVVVVASAGNAGNTPFITGAPGANPRVLAVANTAIVGGGAEATDLMNNGSSRGPSRHGALKPNLSAPGSSIRSAGRGLGETERSFSGTSMSSPHAAGAAALIWSRSRREGLSLSAREVQALLMNYAQPSVDEVGGSFKASVSRQGAGAMNVAAAAEARFLAQSGDIADLSFGMHAETGAIGERMQMVELRNLSSEDLFVLADSAFTGPGDENRGVFVIVPDEPTKVPAGGYAEFPVRLVFEAGSLASWPMREAATTSFLMEGIEIDGHVFLRETDAEGVLVPDAPVASLPFYVVPRRASSIHEIAFVPAEGEAPPIIMLENGSHPGTVELFVSPEAPAGGQASDPAEPEVRHELDLWRVGVKFDASGGSLDFVLAAHELAPMHWLTLSEIFIDTDADGKDDQRIRYGAESVLRGGDVRPQMAVAVAPWDPDTGQPRAQERVLVNTNDDLHSRVQRFSVALADLGMSAPAPIAFYVKRQGLTEDWLGAPDTDVAPDGADAMGAGAPRYTLDPSAWSDAPDAWNLTVPAGGRSVITLEPVAGGGNTSPSLLAYLPENAPGSQLITLGRAADLGPIYLPMLVTNF